MKGMYEVWRTLPEVIRQDPAFEPFRRYGMRQEDSNSLESPANTRKKKWESDKYFACVIFQLKHLTKKYLSKKSF